MPPVEGYRFNPNDAYSQYMRSIRQKFQNQAPGIITGLNQNNPSLRNIRIQGMTERLREIQQNPAQTTPNSNSSASAIKEKILDVYA